MAASETGEMITSKDSLALVDMQNPPAPTQSPVKPAAQNLGSTYSTDGIVVYKPVSGSSPPFQPGGVAAGEGPAGGGGVTYPVHNPNSGDSRKRKRGRPRKYGPDGAITLALVHGVATPHLPGMAAPPGGTFSPPVPPPSAAVPPTPATRSSPPSSAKKARGRPSGSSKKQQKTEALRSAGTGFIPHVITVGRGEDISAKIMSFSQNGPRAVCIMSAVGSISNVTLRQPATSGGTATYEGQFDILSLCGSFLLSEVAGQRSRTGGLSVLLAGSDGQILGGPVAGLFIAATPVQIIAGSFAPDGGKDSKSGNHTEQFSHSLSVHPVSAAGASSPPSRGTLSESSGGPGSPLNHSSGACNNVNTQGMLNMPWK